MSCPGQPEGTQDQGRSIPDSEEPVAEVSADPCTSVDTAAFSEEDAEMPFTSSLSLPGTFSGSEPSAPRGSRQAPVTL